VSGGDLDVAQRDAGVEHGHDERGAEHVWMDLVEDRSSSSTVSAACIGDERSAA
jgi:hypothetical protein